MWRAAGRISLPQAKFFWPLFTILTDYTHFFNTAVTTQYTSQRASSRQRTSFLIPSEKSVSTREQSYGWQLTDHSRVRLTCQYSDCVIAGNRNQDCRIAASSPARATNCPADKASAARRRAVMAAEGSGGGGVAGIMLTHQQRSGSEREREVERESRRV